MRYIIEEETAGMSNGFAKSDHKFAGVELTSASIRSAFIDWLDSEDLYITYWDGQTEDAE